MTGTSILLQPSKEPNRRQLLWGYLQHEILYLAWLLMEVTLLTPFVAIIIPTVRAWAPGLLLIWLLLLMYLPFNLARLMSTMDWPRSRQRFILATAVILIYILTTRTLFYQPTSLFNFSWLSQYFNSIAEEGNVEWLRNLGWFILVMFGWWRGIRLIGKEFYIEKAGRRLRVGGLVLAPFIIWIGFGRATWSAIPFILLFFITSLTAVALTRVEEIEKQQSGRSVSLNPKWLLTVSFVALLLVLATLLLTFITSGTTMMLITGWLDPLWRALYAGGAIAFNTIFSLLTPIIELLFLLLERLFSLFSPIMVDLAEILPTPFENLMPLPEVEDPIQRTEGMKSGFKVINILLMIAIVLGITLALRGVYRKAEFADRDSDSALGMAASPSHSRLNFGQRLLNRLGLFRGWRTAASIRHIYKNMCRAAAINGYSRADTETPFEYLSTLNKAWPENQADTRLITDAYVQVRYGEIPESPDVLDTLREAWKRLETTHPINEKQTQKNKLDLTPLN